MGRRAQKKAELRSLLIDRDMVALRHWIAGDRNPDKVLMGLLFDPDELVRWRAIEGFGELADFAESENGTERVRFIIRNLFWIMNDESGGLGWHAPEAIGQILFRVPRMVREYGRILANFIIEEPFERGTHWALSRVVSFLPEVFEDVIDQLIGTLESPDPYIRAYMAKTLPALIDRGRLETLLAPLAADQTELRIYNTITGELENTTVSAQAADALKIT